MGMKLLSKTEVTAHKGRERQREILEGKKLAARVDRLRELSAQEDKALQEFRTKTLINIHAETKKAEEERDTLKAEVAKLKKEREELKKPLDDEWDKLWSERGVLDRDREQLASDSKLLEQREHELDIHTEQLSREQHRYRIDNQLLAEQQREADANTLEADNLLRYARELHKETLAWKEGEEAEIKEKDINIALRESNVTLKEEHHQAEREALDKEWKLLNDRKAMLERALKRNT